MLKLLFWMSLVTVLMWQSFMIINVYNNNSKAQDVFDLVSHQMVGMSEQTIRERLPDIFLVMHFPRDSLPDAFYEHIEINSENGHVEISSYYHITLWPLGPVEDVNAEGVYYPNELIGMDILRDKLRMDFDFKPHASSQGSKDET